MSARLIAIKACPVAADFRQAILRARYNSMKIVGCGDVPARYLTGQMARLMSDIPNAAKVINTLMKISKQISNQIMKSLLQISSWEYASPE
jgi:hypothetical protein